MARRSKELKADLLSVDAAVEVGSLANRPIELQTENAFHIVRCWEIEKSLPPADGIYRFLVHNENQPTGPREIVVQVSAVAVEQIARSTRGRIALFSSFWIYCAERHLATYLWENDKYPPRNQLGTDPLTPADFALALRWEKT
jgi:hypothetical protein